MLSATIRPRQQNLSLQIWRGVPSAAIHSAVYVTHKVLQHCLAIRRNSIGCFSKTYQLTSHIQVGQQKIHVVRIISNAFWSFSWAARAQVLFAADLTDIHWQQYLYAVRRVFWPNTPQLIGHFLSRSTWLLRRCKHGCAPYHDAYSPGKLESSR